MAARGLWSTALQPGECQLQEVPHESILGPGFFNILINDIDSEIEYTFSKFAYDNNLVVDMTEGKNAIQRDLNKLEKRAHVNLNRFNKANCKVLHLCQNNPQYEYRLGEESLRANLQRMSWEL